MFATSVNVFRQMVGWKFGGSVYSAAASELCCLAALNLGRPLLSDEENTHVNGERFAPGRDAVKHDTILLIGASSAVGGAIVDGLGPARKTTQRRPDSGRTTDSIGATVSRIPASVDRLGLSPGRYDKLAGDVEFVIHATSAPMLPGRASEFLRVVREALDFARYAEKPLFFVSSALWTERENGVSSVTGVTLARAEAMIAASGVPHVILRPSNVIGDSETGAISQFPAIYELVQLLLQERLRGSGADGNWLLDVVPCDVVADTVINLIGSGFTDGEYWLTSGELSLTLEGVIDVLAECLSEEEGASHLGRRESNLSVAGTCTNAGAPKGQPTKTGVARVGLDDSSMVTTLLTRCPLESSLGGTFVTSISELGGIGGRPMPDPRLSLARSVRFWRGIVRQLDPCAQERC